MSCNCKNNTTNEGQFNCQCDRFSALPDLKIDAGLHELPRQVAGFPEYRRAMLYAIRQKRPLQNWAAREEDDLGMMLLEMWAYVCDAVSFYDTVIAQEAYVRTAHLRPSLRRMVALLGYLPRPALAATVQLSAFADGRLSVALPKGLAFRSGGFEGNPPQVFELDEASTIHSLTNRWAVRRPVSNVIGNQGYLLVQGVQANIQAGSLLLLVKTGNPDANVGFKVKSISSFTGSDRKNYTRINFDPPLNWPSPAPELEKLVLMAPAQSAALWTATETAISANTIVLDNIYRQITANDYLVMEKSGTETHCVKVQSLSDELRTSNARTGTFKIGNSTFDFPQISISVTKLTLNRNISWPDDVKNTIKVYFGFSQAATIVNEPSTTLKWNDDINLEGQVEKPVDGPRPKHFILQDKNLRANTISGDIDYAERKINPKAPNPSQTELTLPVSAFGNVLNASRGETVKNEILGSGNASLTNQAFRLNKKPLTYLFSPTAANQQGIQNTLVVYVEGIRWNEVRTFYGAGPADEVYIVRQNDEGETQIMFGDGIRGRRLPSGTDNVVAHYRYGAGYASPPAGSINQITKPVVGLSAIENPIAASGGADAEAEIGLRSNASKSALLLGRVISIKDMEAAALSVPGVRAVQSSWQWVPERQSSMAVISFIGEPDLDEKVWSYLRDLTDPSTPIQVIQALAIPCTLTLTIETDDRYVEKNVLDEIRIKLFAPGTGLLSLERIGIGRPLFRSRIFETVLSVPGTISIKEILWNNARFDQASQKPGSGQYFEIKEVLEGPRSLVASPVQASLYIPRQRDKKEAPGSYAFFGKRFSQNKGTIKRR